MSLVEEALRFVRDVPATATPAVAVVELQPAAARIETPVGTTLGRSDRLVNLDPAQLREGGLMVPEEEERQLGSQFRAAKRPLIKDALQSTVAANGKAMPMRAILVTSALPGDGKTFTAFNLAVSLARERDFSVLLVDGDIVKPRLTRTLKQENADGLTDLLGRTERTVASVVRPTSMPGLSFLPAGKPLDIASELIASERMSQLLEEMVASDPRLLIVVDSPPILVTSEARALAALCGQILVVVRAGVTPQQAVVDSLQILREEARAKLLLNEAVHGGVDAYYGYGYGYGQPDGDKPA